MVTENGCLQRVGYEVEFSAAHDFLDLSDLYIGGGAFRGCVANLTLNNELQSLTTAASSSSHQLLAYVPSSSGEGAPLAGCDVDVLSVSADPRTSVDIGVSCNATIY